MRIGPALLLVATLACVGGCSEKVPDGTGAENFRPPTNLTRADDLDRLNRNFARMDGNGDEALQAREITGVRAERIRVLDTDGDGEVSREEFVKGGLARFDRIDANHDGVLTNGERRAARREDDAKGGDTTDTPTK
ncbi:MAG: calcium-binding protein [Sphingomonas sp.]